MAQATRFSRRVVVRTVLGILLGVSSVAVGASARAQAPDDNPDTIFARLAASPWRSAALPDGYQVTGERTEATCLQVNENGPPSATPCRQISIDIALPAGSAEPLPPATILYAVKDSVAAARQAFVGDFPLPAYAWLLNLDGLSVPAGCHLTEHPEDGPDDCETLVGQVLIRATAVNAEHTPEGRSALRLLAAAVMDVLPLLPG